MLILLRKLKHNLFTSGEFRKYLLCALGEMVLVIIGILIALQIDNWNTARKDRETLESYLQSIARNVSADLSAAEQVRARREEAIESSIVKWALVAPSAYDDVGAVTFSYRALLEARAHHELQTNESGYEALKSSGILDQLQGADIEALLYDYYDTVARIESAEQNYNEYSRELWMQILTNWPEGMDEWEVADPTVLTRPRFDELEPDFLRLLSGTHAQALGVHAASVGPLLREYERLQFLGEAFIHMVDNGLMNFDAEAADALSRIHDSGDGAGYPVLVDQGRIVWHSYTLIAADSNVRSVSLSASEEPASDSGPRGLDFRSVAWADESMDLTYPGGADWAGVWIITGLASTARLGMDFSDFDTLSLELKCDTGSETVFVELQDVDDIPDGTQTRVAIPITDEWQTYEVDLSEFETADSTKLRVVAGFVFGGEPSSYSVRNIRYLDKD